MRRAIKSCRNSKAFRPDKLSIFNLKHLGPRAIEYINALFNLSVTTCQITAIWKYSLIIPIPKPGKDTSIGTSYQSISLLCPALLQMTTYITMGFNQRKLLDRTMCAAVDLSAAFDTVCHNNLLSKINRSPLPLATARWLSCYLRGRPAKTCFRGGQSTSKKVNTGVRLQTVIVAVQLLYC